MGAAVLFVLFIVAIFELFYPASQVGNLGVILVLRFVIVALFGLLFIVLYRTYAVALSTEASNKRTYDTLRSMLDNLPVGVYRSTGDGRFIEANRACARLLGYESTSDLKQVDLGDVFVRKSDRESQLEKLREAPVFAEFEMRRRDGTTVWVRDYPTPTLGIDGAVEYMDGVIMETYSIDAIVHDITEHRRLEVMRNQFAIAVTHELRTPLVSINGYLDYVLGEEPNVMLKDVTSDLVVVKHNADRLLELTNDLLDLQRMESGKYKLKLQTVSFRDLIKECLEEIEPLVTQKNERVHLDLPNGPLSIEGDHLRLSQVLTNLLNNAVKFTPDGGDFTIRVEEDDEALRVIVQDTGIGIDRKDIGRLFEPFAAIEKPTYYKGTGLGLSLTKKLIEAHGGKISADSPGKGQGATFTIVLPKKRIEASIYG